MSTVTIYHNPRCTKSRQTLALLKDQGIEPIVVEYLKDPLDEQTLTVILSKLGVSAKDIVRHKEFRELGVDMPERDAELVRLMVDHPEVIERPIVVHGRKARLGRPPEKVLDIL